MADTRTPEIRIEFPSRGATYCNEEYGVYEYGEWPRGSVLYGRERRTFLTSFDTLEEAQAAYPTATVAGCGFRDDPLNDIPDAADL